MESEPTFLRDCGQSFTVLLTDHYGIDAAWQRAAADLASAVVAVDDEAKTELSADLILNQNLGYSSADYLGLARTNSRLLIGPQYALLHREFAEARQDGLRIRDGVKRIFVFLSGGDIDNITGRVVNTLGSLGYLLDVVIGSAYPHRRELHGLAARRPLVTVHENTSQVASLMSMADLAVGAPSSASWERCCLGLPAVTITLAENQSRVASALRDAGATVSLGWHSGVRDSTIRAAVSELAAQPQRLSEMSGLASGITDGNGVQRVADAIAEVVP